MARDEEDLYDEEFDFVDEEDDDADDEKEPVEEFDEDEAEEVGEEPAGDAAEDAFDEYGRPGPTANYVVHIYEYKKFKRTIDRPFTPEDAEAFATEYNRTAKSYGRLAVAGKNDVKPKKNVD